MTDKNNTDNRAVSDTPAVASADYGAVPTLASAQPSDYQGPAPVEPYKAIRERIAEVGRSNIVIVDAQVEAMSVSRRMLPEELHWGSIPHIVTSVTLSISKTYCGDQNMTSLTASYVGGRLADGSVEVTEVTPQNLSVGKSNVFLLRRMANEYFLELGSQDMLSRDDKGHIVSSSAEPIETKFIEEMCR